MGRSVLRHFIWARITSPPLASPEERGQRMIEEVHVAYDPPARLIAQELCRGTRMTEFWDAVRRR